MQTSSSGAGTFAAGSPSAEARRPAPPQAVDGTSPPAAAGFVRPPRGPDAVASFAGAALNTVSLFSPRLAGGGAYALFRRPLRRARVRDGERAFHDAAVTGHHTVAGRRVAVYRWGDGTRPVLLLHGWRSRASRYAGMAGALLERGFSPISFDAPGHGDSEGNATTVLHYREISRLLQEEYGAFEGVVAHSFAVLSMFHSLRTGLSAHRAVAVAGVCRFGFPAEEYSARLGLRPPVRAELDKRVEHRLLAPETGVRERFSASHRPDLVVPPILVVHDSDDDMVPLTEAHALTAAFPRQARLLVTSGLGHRRILADPGVVEAVLGFLDPPPEPAE